MLFTREEMKALRGSAEYKDASDTALNIHQQIHDPAATHFKDCLECKSGFALLLIANLRGCKQPLILMLNQESIENSGPAAEKASLPSTGST